MTIAVITHDPRWRGHIRAVRAAARATLHDQQMVRADVAIVLSHDAEVQGLNKTYRGFDKPTNVLSFTDGSEQCGRRQLGDIIIAYETVRRESEAQNKPFKSHLAHLVVHGMLHLLGYDHERAAEAKRMESKEIALLAAMDIANPYESA
jgi:probable rRNA maturation factor